MDYSEYRKFDAIGLADLVRRKEARASELLDCALERTEQVDPVLNAVVHRMDGVARERAARPLSGKLAGVPFLLKDLHQDYRGEPTGSGTKATRGSVADRHSAAVERWLEAGLIVFGRTNTPEFGAKGITEPTANGPSRNPWDTSRTPGGSSGGSAAAVAAGIVPVAGASDGGGSIRIPSALCGVFGLKAGRGIVPAGPDFAELLHGTATDGVVSRTVRDSALMLDVLTSKVDRGGPYLPARPRDSYLELSRQRPPRLRVGYSCKSPLGSPISESAEAAVQHAVTLLGNLGHEVVECEPEIDGLQMARDFLTFWYAQLAGTVERHREEHGARIRDFELDTLMLAAGGRRTRAVEYAAVMQRWNDYNRALAAYHQRFDLFLTPTVAFPPAEIGSLDPSPALRASMAVALRLGVAGLISRLSVVDKVVLRNLEQVPFTQLANTTGRPAMSVPLYWTPGGSPSECSSSAASGAKG